MHYPRFFMNLPRVAFYVLFYKLRGLELKTVFSTHIQRSTSPMHMSPPALMLLHTVRVFAFSMTLFWGFLCATSSRCQPSSWPSSSSSCRSSRSSSNTCSTSRGKGCSPSSQDRPACHCTRSLRVSTSNQFKPPLRRSASSQLRLRDIVIYPEK